VGSVMEQRVPCCLRCAAISLDEWSRYLQGSRCSWAIRQPGDNNNGHKDIFKHGNPHFLPVTLLYTATA